MPHLVVLAVLHLTLNACGNADQGVRGHIHRPDCGGFAHGQRGDITREDHDPMIVIKVRTE
jgi:hypothetical protein